MAKYLIPLATKVSEDIKLPFDLCPRGTAKASLQGLSRDEVKTVFGYVIIDDPNDPTRHQFLVPTSRLHFHSPTLTHALAEAHLQILIEAPTNPAADTLKDQVVFALRCVLGQPCTTIAVETEFDQKTSWSLLSDGKGFSAPAIKTMDIEALRNIQKIISHVPAPELEQKIKTLKALFNSAMSQVGARDVSCVLYFSILESIYVQSNQELTYKLAMRLTKKLGKNHKFMNKIVYLYSRRGDVIHGTEKGAVFSTEEYELLKGLALSSFLNYIDNPNDFSNTKLDNLLLS